MSLIPVRERSAPSPVALVVIATALCVVALCLGVGARSATPSLSNVRFHDAAMHVFVIAAGDILDAAGVRAGDDIVAVDGVGVTSALGFADHLAAARPGDVIRFTVRRGGETLQLGARAEPILSRSRLMVALAPILVVLVAGIGVEVARPRTLPTLLFLLYCTTTAVNNACQLTVVVGTAWPQRVITLFYTMVSLQSPAILLHLFVVFPERRRVQRRIALWLPAAYSIQLALGLTYYLPTILPEHTAFLRDPTLHRVLFQAFGANVVLCYALSALSLAAVARRGSTDRVRQQARLLFFAFALLTALQLGVDEVPMRLTGRTLLPPTAMTLLDLILPAFVVVAILRHRLFGIDLLVRRGLIYGTATAAVAAVFGLTGAAVGWVAEKLWSSPDLVVMAAASAAAALAFPPLQRCSRDWVDRVLYHRRHSYRLVLSDLSAQLTAPHDAASAALLLRTRLAAVLEPENLTVAVYRSPPGVFEEVADDGSFHSLWGGEEAAAVCTRLLALPGPFRPDAGGGAPFSLLAPITRGETVLGCVLLGPRRAGVPYLVDDVELVAAVTRLAAPVLENARLHEERAARERLAMVGSAAAAIAHELKNPLAAIRSTAAILRRRLSADPRGQELTVVVEEEAARLERSALEVLTFVRPRKGELVLVGLNELVQQLLMVVEEEFSQSGVTLRLEPDPVEPVVLGDAERLRQAVLNLLLNARQAMPRGGSVEVVVRPWPDGERHGTEVAVTDTGPGFTSEALERAGEPFFSTKRLGTGLGLANVRRVAEETGGQLMIANRPGGGAQVALRLPGPPEENP